MKPYPSIDGVPVPTEEVGLAPSRLDPNNPHNWNNHHLYFSKSSYAGDFLYNTLRNLERSQEDMLKDRHNIGKATLHATYGPPERPSPIQAMHEIADAFFNEEKLKIWSQSAGKYVLKSMSDNYFRELHRHYTKLRRES